MMAEPTGTVDSMMAESSAAPGAMMEEKTPAPGAMMGTATPTPTVTMSQTQMTAPEWFGATLKDVTTGESLTVADRHGQVILVETMAVWCTTCLQQQKQIQGLRESLGARQDLTVLSLDIDPNENEAILKEHANRYHFDWRFAVAPAGVAREIGQLYGDQFLNPTSAPMLVVDRQGQVHPLPFGVKSAQDLQMALEPFLKPGA